MATSPFINPEQLQQRAQLMPQGQGPLPPTSPVQPGQGMGNPASGGMDPAMMKMIMDLAQQQSGQIQKLGGVADTIGDVAGQIQQPVPKMGPQIEKGGSFLHNLGQALLMAGGMTGPGQDLNAMIYGPGIRRYGAEQAQKAERIGALKGEAGALSEGIKGAGETESGLGMAAWRSGELANQQERNRIRQEMVDQNSRKVDVAVKTLDLKRLMSGDQMALMEAKTKLAGIMPSIYEQRMGIEKYGIDLMAETRTALGNAMLQAGMPKEFPISAFIDSLTGSSLTPPAPQVQSGAQPVQGPSKLPARGTAAKPAKGSAAQHVPGGKASGLTEGQTGTGSDNKKYVVRGGVWQAQ